MQNLLNELTELLSKDERLISEGSLLKNKVIELALAVDSGLIKLLLKNKSIKKHFFTDIDGVLVFDKIAFQKFVSNKEFLPESYTAFKNKIGLVNENGDYLSESREVVLAWPYKDCVLEGGQTKEDQKRDEIFWNENLAPDEIDRLLSPKVLTSFKKYDEKGEHVLTGKEQIDFTKENLIIKGNNLLALHSLYKNFAGKVKLIYIDPPYNRDADSFYNDNFKHSTWLTFMENRLNIAKKLLKNNGAFFVQCDDTEIGYLKVLMDEIFHRENYLNTITIKAKIAGVSGSHAGKSLAKKTEYVLFYAKDAKEFELANELYEKEELFGFIESMRDEEKSWKYTTVLEDIDGGKYVKSITDGYNNEIKIYKHDKYSFKSINQIAKEKYDGDLKKAYYGEINKIFRTTNAQSSIRTRVMESTSDISNEIISIKYKPQSGRNAGKEISLFFKDRIRNLVTMLRDVVQVEKGRIFKLEKLGTLWTDVQYNNLTREGEVQFPNGKKPEKIIQNILELATNPGDIVLDYHVGSGTTCAVAHKMGRQYIGIEQLDYGDSDSVVRLQNVINGDQSGISKSIQWQGGGSFIGCETMAYNETYETLIKKTKTTKELISIWKEMQEKAFISYKVDPKQFNENIAEFEKLSMEDQKRLLFETLDKNQLYVNYSEIDDKDNDVSETDKKLNRKFYGEA